MLNIIGWIVLGLIIIGIGTFGLKFTLDINHFVLQLLLGLFFILVIGFGLLVPFKPLMDKNNHDETLNMKACKSIGGSYEVIDKVWNGKFYTNVYGCIKK